MLRLAFRYAACYRWKTLVLVLSLSLAAYLPVATQLVLQRVQDELHYRAESTPLVLGASGSRYELALHALYFQTPPPGLLSVAALRRIEETGWGNVIPLHARYRARGYPLVGTNLEYFRFRNLELAAGSPLVRLGDCVLGAEVARHLQLRVGDTILSDLESFLELTEYPLKMRVTGILKPVGGPDDRAVFCDLKTAWVIQGIGHGHYDPVTQDEVLRTDGDRVVASPALTQFQEITPENLHTFHFHGDLDEYPLTAALVVPTDDRAATLLLGRFASRPPAGESSTGSSGNSSGDSFKGSRNHHAQAEVQLVVPQEIVAQILGTLLTLKRFFDANTALVGVSTGLLILLVVWLSYRLRSRERQTLYKLGCSRRTVAGLLLLELAIVGVAATLVVGSATWFTSRYASEWVQRLL